MSFSPHIDNKEKDILVLGKEPTQGFTYINYRKNVFN